jgi:crotonobetainyl-CoA:carnitine CoA-transferase CaiB-like acyl-CoA transferase
LGAPQLLDDERFATAKARAANRALVIERLSALTGALTKAELQAKLGGVVPFGPVMDIAEIARDPHFQARGMLAEIELPGFPEPMKIAGQPIKFAGTPAGVRRRGPQLGEDTEAVLRAHGASDQDLANWRAAGAIAETNP